MSNISQKLTYLNETKSQLKDMINYGLPSEQQITSSTTFRNYVSSIFEAFLEALRTPDTLFTNLPKKSGSGSVISLNDTANAPMRIELGASELTQDGTPTPSSPQDIHTISGSNTIKVRGKNLIDIASTYTLTEYKTIQVDIPAGTYVLSVDSRTSTADSSLVLFQNGNTTISQTYLSVGSLEKNINLSTKVNKMLIYSGSNYTESVNVETTFTNLMVSKDGGTYEPYISQEAEVDLGNIEYSKIGNYEDKFIRTSGRNSIPFTNQDFTLNSVRYYVQDGSLILNGTSTSETSSKNTNFKNNFSFTLEAGTYTISHKTGVVGAHLYNYDNDSSSIITLATNIASATFTLNEETKVYIGFYVYQNNFSNINTELMISKVGGDYEPYGSKKWYIKKNIRHISLNISDMNRSDDYPGWSGVPYLHDDYPGLNIAMFPTSSIKSNIGGTASFFGIATTSSNSILLLNKGAWNKTQTEWINDYPNLVLEFYYALATPTYTQITGTLAEQLENIYQKLLSYSGTTNISQINNDLGFVMSVSAIEEL